MVGGGKLAVHPFHEPPCGRFAICNTLAAGEICYGSVALEYAVEATEVVAHVACEEGAVYVAVGQLLISAVHYIVVWVVIHDAEHLLAVGAYHLAVAPGYSGAKERHCLYILKAAEPSRELHGVCRDELCGVHAPSLSVEPFPQVCGYLRRYDR